jgi:hypothetical protein
MEIAYKPSDELLGYSDVPLIANRPYIPTYYEWLREQGTPIIQGGSVTLQNDYGVYTVPAGYTLYLNSIYLDTNLATGTQATLYLNLLGSQKFIQVNGVKVATISYPIPVKIDAKQQMILSTLGNGLVQYGFTGFLVSNAYIFQNFLK